jgi:hypothetical protein
VLQARAPQAQEQEAQGQEPQALQELPGPGPQAQEPEVQALAQVPGPGPQVQEPGAQALEQVPGLQVRERVPGPAQERVLDLADPVPERRAVGPPQVPARREPAQEPRRLAVAVRQPAAAVRAMSEATGRRVQRRPEPQLPAPWPDRRRPSRCLLGLRLS